nr:MAG TPA: hypothetical protein [Caudoviricetes sp.]
MKHQPEGERNSKSKIEIVITSHDFLPCKTGAEMPRLPKGAMN